MCEQYISNEVKKQINEDFSTPPAPGVDLSQYSQGDKPWDTHRGECQQLATKLSTVDEDRYIMRQAERLSTCAPWLVFATTKMKGEDASDKLNFRLHRAEFCRVRTCPVCQWRRSMLTVARIMSALPLVLEELPTTRLIHLVLTVRNVDITELRATLSEMNKSFKRMTERKVFRQSVRGFIRSTEVTRGSDNTAHPHFHIMLAVPEYYFTHSNVYITHDGWRNLWADCARLDYLPQTSITAFRTGGHQRLAKAVHELAKYATKPSDLIDAPLPWLVAYIHQVYKLRFLSAGGILRDALAQADENYDNENLITVGEEKSDNSDIIRQSLFDWHPLASRYRHTETRDAPPPSPVTLSPEAR